jgi:DNA-binding transcriptional LysR family regulator
MICALQVDQSRRICDAVASGQLDVAIIGGEVPDDLQASLKAVTYAEDQLVRLLPGREMPFSVHRYSGSCLPGLTFVV